MYEDLTILRSTTIIDETGAEAPIAVRQVAVPGAEGEPETYQIEFQQGLTKFAFRPEVAAAVADQMADLASDFLVETEVE